MPAALGPRFVLEAGFLILLAVVLGFADLSAALIILVLAASPVAFVLLAVVLAGIAVGGRPGLPLRAAAVPAAAVAVAAAAELVTVHLFPVGSLGFPGVEAVQAVVFCVFLLALTWRLERARGLRGVLAVYLVAVVAIYVIPFVIKGSVGPVSSTISILPLALIPLAFAVSILKYKLWDVEVVIKEVLAYSITFVFGIIAFSTVNLVLSRVIEERAAMCRLSRGSVRRDAGLR